MQDEILIQKELTIEKNEELFNEKLMKEALVAKEIVDDAVFEVHRGGREDGLGRDESESARGTTPFCRRRRRRSRRRTVVMEKERERESLCVC